MERRWQRRCSARVYHKLRGSNTLRFAPPLIISEGEISAMTAALDRVLSQFSKTE